MGHTVQAFIARAEVFQAAGRRPEAARVVSVGQGFALLLNTDALSDGVGGGGELPYQEFYKLSRGLANLAAEWSAGGAVAYFETDYWGGEGKQAAMLWERGEIVYGPAKATLGPINDVLRRMGVGRGTAQDEFDAVGLGRCRDNEDWMAHPGYDASA